MKLRFILKRNAHAVNTIRAFSLCYLHAKPPSCNSENGLVDHLLQRIKATGPISVASYMKEALTNPIWGYYMKNDVFGKEGDFITSPEISQVFGELIGIWLYAHWAQTGKQEPVQLVELGPGRGTLMADIIRVIQQFEGQNIYEKFSIHFVEVSEKMKELQSNNVFGNSTRDSCKKHGELSVSWHQHIDDIPKGCSFFIAHEFFDALPVHLFQKVDGEWREILVGYSRESRKLRFVSAPGPSVIANSFIDSTVPREQCEVCLEGAATVSKITENIAEHGGCALIVDYGEEYSCRHSIRGFRGHELVEDILEDPGNVDITANVDFSLLKKSGYDKKVSFHGPITQSEFLHRMGIRARVQILKIERKGFHVADLHYSLKPYAEAS